nr:helix-turn-helix domain-containing protein [Veillonella montpellierensis]
MTTEKAGERWNLSTSTVKGLCMGGRKNDHHD